MKYKITIEETIVQEFEVEADTAEEALETAKEKYHNGQFVLDDCEVQYKQMAVVEPEDEKTDFQEF